MAAAARAELDPWLNGANPDNPTHRAGLAPPALEPLKRYRLAKKVLKAYGEGYALHLSPVTGRLHPGYFLGGTATGRLTSEPPNLQQASRDPAFRALFAPRGGRRLVVGDYRQLELRVAAQRSNDPRMAVQEGGTEGFNTRVQSGAAECLLAALAALDLPGGAALVAIVDNELVVECDPKQTGRVAAEVERAMTAGFLAIFPNGAIHDLVAAHSGPNWAAAKGYFQAGSSVLTLPNGAAESSDPNGTVALRPP
jgi:DNA polymerase I-like protein with 3'-5' exonuclease and polymerase domains